MELPELPIPPHFKPDRVREVWKVDYQEIAKSAGEWAGRHRLQSTAEDSFRVALLLVDCQNTFCTPGYELFVSGRSGNAAVEDSRRICNFIYRNLASLTTIAVSMDTHMAVQIFHSAFLVNEGGENPPPYTEISAHEIAEGKWKVSPWAINSTSLGAGRDPQEYLLHYARRLEASGKYTLMVWPYHAMLGGIGHALVSAIEEAVFFHTIARGTQTLFVVKGNNALTEHYSILRPEVTEDTGGERIASANEKLVTDLLEYDAVVIAGQAKSHCVAWTVSDFLEIIKKRDVELAKKVYLLDDCTSPVVIEGGVDFTDKADEAFACFAAAGMNIVRSTDPISSWPGIGD